MEVLVNVMSWMFPDFKMQWLVEETKKNLPVELDFMNEGRNADKVCSCTTLVDNQKIYNIFIISRINSLGPRNVQRIRLAEDSAHPLGTLHNPRAGHGLSTRRSGGRH